MGGDSRTVHDPASPMLLRPARIFPFPDSCPRSCYCPTHAPVKLSFPVLLPPPTPLPFPRLMSHSMLLSPDLFNAPQIPLLSCPIPCFCPGSFLIQGSCPSQAPVPSHAADLLYAHAPPKPLLRCPLSCSCPSHSPPGSCLLPSSFLVQGPCPLPYPCPLPPLPSIFSYYGIVLIYILKVII